jgi:hypothetical protein
MDKVHQFLRRLRRKVFLYPRFGVTNELPCDAHVTDGHTPALEGMEDVLFPLEGDLTGYRTTNLSSPPTL